MARAIWTGSVSFGLVNVPVGLYSATHDHQVHFHQFEEGTSSRVRNQRVNEDTGEEVDYGDIVKGAEVDEGEYVMLTPEELESVEPGRSRTIDISDFVEAADIDPIHYRKTYYLAPAEESAEKAYMLLVKAMDKAGRIGVATFVMRGKQYLAAIRPSPDAKVLVLETMFFADEVRDPTEEIGALPVRTRVAKKDLDMAVSLVESLTVPWNPSNYRDTYADRVQKLIDAKRKDREVVSRASRGESAEKVTDLLSALQASVERAKGHRAGNTHDLPSLRTQKRKDEEKSSAEKSAAKKSAAKKSTAKKSAAKKSTTKKSTTKKSTTKKSAAKKSA
jgi:DNA end-binding protein Ku